MVKMLLMHNIVLKYACGVSCGGGSVRGSITGDHIGNEVDEDKLDIRPCNLRPFPQEINLFRQSERFKAVKPGKRFTLPMHKFMIDPYLYIDEDGKRTKPPKNKKGKKHMPNPNKKKFRAPFSKKLFMAYPSGRRLHEKFSYKEGTTYKCSTSLTTGKTKKQIAQTFELIAFLVCEFLLVLLQDGKLDSVGPGYRGRSKTEAIKYLKERHSTLKASLPAKLLNPKKRKRQASLKF